MNNILSYNMLDGKNLFLDDEAYSKHSWRVAETLQFYPNIQDLIVVGIYNSENRVFEYSPRKIEHDHENET